MAKKWMVPMQVKVNTYALVEASDADDAREQAEQGNFIEVELTNGEIICWTATGRGTSAD